MKLLVDIDDDVVDVVVVDVELKKFVSANGDSRTVNSSCSRSFRSRSSSSFCNWIFRLISSRIFAVCSTTNATGNDENDDIDGWTSSTIESSASTVAVVVVVWDDVASGGGKFVIGDIGASLINFLQC